MGFFDAMRKALGGQQGPPDPALARAGGLDDEVAASESGAYDAPSAYDRAQWRRRLKRMLDALPDSKPGWEDMLADARALHFEPGWMDDCLREEFRLMVRRAVSDRKFTAAEHRNIDLARDLMGIPEAEAVEILHGVVAEAEAFFGGKIEEN